MRSGRAERPLTSGLLMVGLGLPGLVAAEAGLPPPLQLMLARSGLEVNAAVAPEALPDTPPPLVGEASPGSSTAAAGRKVRRSRLVGAGIILGWGFLQWDYGERSPHVQSEGWFGQDTAEGGADKLGHLYTGHVLARAMAALYRSWGLDTAPAAREGALTSLLVTSVMELGDSFSPYGLSGEDMVMNLLGAGTGYALAAWPAWQERLDLRVEYRLHSGVDDISTDYEHARYLLALKPAGFARLNAPPWRWLELQGGYFARGYAEAGAPDRRTLYAGVGLNLPLLARRAGLPGLGTFLQFYQPPDSTLRRETPL